jgi:hypothetical protein
MYDKSDPRAGLSTTTTTAPVWSSYTPADYERFYERQPQESGDWGRSWYVRGENGIIVYSELEPGTVLERKGQIDEWVLLQPDHDTAATVVAGGETKAVAGYTVTFIPPGDSAVTIGKGGRFVRLYTTRSEDLVALCPNKAAHATRHENVPDFKPWPVPKDGYRIRSYSLDVPDEPGRFGRIWRCTTFMVNYLAPQQGPRDITKLSPHHHDDFEQYSLAVQGSFIHHMRWPWTPDMRIWRQDESEFCGTPSVAVIPPPAIHTTRGMDPGTNQLVDIFSPPRMDFSLKPGWVLNPDDYPMP